ncbi:MAG: AmmeMemoRadiSam system protein B [Kiritimatiellae bacterium]|nr:AmmeMemoRadiSam system protein B [Kiritimatiellia bacterium]
MNGVGRQLEWSAAALLAVLLLGCGAKPGERQADSAEPPPEPAPARPSGVRPPVAAAKLYEGEPEKLRAQVDDLLRQVKPAAGEGELLAGVVPHGAYAVAGRCAAEFYGRLPRGRCTRVVLLAPSHYANFAGIVVASPDIGTYDTPLGGVPLDYKTCNWLLGYEGFLTSAAAEEREYSVEVQLPFLQRALDRFELVPLLCGRIAVDELVPYARVLARLMDGRTLFIASSDFTHYGPAYRYVPFTEDVAENLGKRLEATAAMVARLELPEFHRHCEATGDTICGEMALKLLMGVLKASKVPALGRVLGRCLSGDVKGDYANSVSYAAIGFFVEHMGLLPKEANMIKEERSGDWSPGLTDAEKATLFDIARTTIAWCTGREAGGKFDFSGCALTDRLRENFATFVTLKKQGLLRGCIGSLAPVDPLYLSVHHNAVNAATQDPRFPPVEPDEVAALEIHVSVLSPITQIGAPDEFRIGQDGIIIEKGGRRAVYLPEVAVEQGWTREETLSSLSRKAGLPSDAWREGARFKVFQSVVLSEE